MKKEAVQLDELKGGITTFTLFRLANFFNEGYLILNYTQRAVYSLLLLLATDEE